jgi:hypothetical protein
MNKSNPAHLLILLFLLPLLSACNILVSEPVVLTAGRAGSPNRAAWWRDTTRADLPSPGLYGSSAQSLHVVGADVYSGGYFFDGLGNEQPCYWRNESLVELDMTGTRAVVAGIFCARGKVYSAGHDIQSDKYPCVWIGSRQIMLSPAPGTAAGLFVSGDAVHILGYDTSSSEALYWKYSGSGPVPEPVALPFIRGSTGDAFSIFVSDGIVYVPGWYLNGTSHTPCYWADLARTDLALPPAAVPNTDSAANAICVDAGVVYSGGHYTDGGWEVPCYWKGAAITVLPLPPAATGGEVLSIRALQGVVYTAGYCFIGGQNRACYWKGTQRVELPGDASAGSWANAIFVD